MASSYAPVIAWLDRSASALMIAGWCIAVSAFVGASAGLGGAAFDEAVLVSVATLLQMLFGAAVWLSVMKSRTPGLVELLGVGLVLGALGYASVSMCLLVFPLTPTPLSAWAILIILGLSGVIVLWQRLRCLSVHLSRTEGMAVVLVLAAALTLSMILWAHVQLPQMIVEWGSLSGDAAVEEARARSIPSLGLNDYLLATGTPLRYHWLSQAWTGFVQLAVNAGPYIISTRTLPVLALTATGLLTWAWIRVLSGRAGPAFWSLAGVFLLGVGQLNSVLFPGSMSQLWVGPLLLLVVLTWTHAQRANVRFLIPFFSWIFVGAILTKSTAIVILLSVLVASFFVVNKGTKRSLVLSSAVATLAAVSSALIFLFGYGNSLSLGVRQSLIYMRMIGENPPFLWLATGVLGAAIGLAAPWFPIALVFLSERRKGTALFALAGSAGLLGLAGALLTAQWGQSQFYFVIAANTIIVPLAAWGLSLASEMLSPRRATLVLGAATGVMLLASWFGMGQVQSLARSASILLIGIGSAAIAYALVRNSKKRSRLTLSYVSLILAPVVIVPVALTSVQHGVTAAPQYAADSANSISRDQIDAIQWLANANVDNELVATNFVCNDPGKKPPDCLSIQFPVAALGGQRMLLEGYSYAVGNNSPEWALGRLALVEDFVQNPSRESHAELLKAGVRWLFIDRRRTEQVTWEPFACVARQSANALVLRLSIEEC